MAIKILLAIKLHLSRRQIDCLIIIYKEKGKSGFIHGNRSKKPVNKLEEHFSEDIIAKSDKENPIYLYYQKRNKRINTIMLV